MGLDVEWGVDGFDEMEEGEGGLEGERVNLRRPRLPGGDCDMSRRISVTIKRSNLEIHQTNIRVKVGNEQSKSTNSRLHTE